VRVLVVNWRDIRNPEAGGAEVHLHEIFRRIARRGHEVVLLAHAFGDAPARESIDGIDVHRRGPRNTFNFVVPGALTGPLDPHGFDVVVDDLNKIPFYTPLYVRRPVVVLLHHFFGTSIFREAPLPVALYVCLHEAVVPFAYRRATFAVVSKSTRDELASRGVAPERIALVTNAVDHDVFRPAPPQEKDPDLVVCLGRVKRYKNIDLVIRAMRRVRARRPRARLLVVGEGDYRPALEALAHGLGLNGTVSFSGFVPQEEKVRLLQRAALSVTASPKEGWGVTVIEANACGTPVVATNVPGLRDAVVDGTTGRLVPYGSLDAMEAAMLDLLEDGAQRRRLSEGALRWAARFSWDESAGALLDLLERAAAGARR
jgi:glycosyltransferase involved in cell wall biosynthesis